MATKALIHREGGLNRVPACGVLENRLMRYLQAGTLVVCLFLCGCGGEPYTYESNNELKTGPGLFSGEDGEIKIFEQKKEDKQEKE